MINGEDGLTATDRQQLAAMQARARHRVLMALRLARAVKGMADGKKVRIWARFDLVMAMRRAAR